MGRLCWTRQVWGNGGLAQAAVQLLKSPVPYVPHGFLMKSSGIVFSCQAEEGLPQSPAQTFRRGHGHCGSRGSSLIPALQRFAQPQGLPTASPLGRCRCFSLFPHAFATPAPCCWCQKIASISISPGLMRMCSYLIVYQQWAEGSEMGEQVHVASWALRSRGELLSLTKSSLAAKLGGVNTPAQALSCAILPNVPLKIRTT